MSNTLERGEVGLGDGFISNQDRRVAELHRAERARQRQALSLQRENILSQRTSHPARRMALEAALKEIESQLAALG